jgi:hypothetical protein
MLPTCDPQHQAFLPSPVSAGAVLQRLRQHLAACGLPVHYTLHSFRRGGNQYLHDQGVRSEAIQARMMVKSRQVVDLYNNMTWPTRAQVVAYGPAISPVLAPAEGWATACGRPWLDLNLPADEL